MCTVQIFLVKQGEMQISEGNFTVQMSLKLVITHNQSNQKYDCYYYFFSKNIIII